MNNITKLKWVYFFKSLFFFSPIITLFYFSRGLDTFQVISLEAVLIIAVLLAELPTGIIADKISRKLSLTSLIIFYIIGNIWTIYAQTYFEFMTIQILFGIGIAFGSGAVEALVYDTLKFQKREKEMSKVWGSINSYSLVACVIAVTVGGYIARSHEPETFVLLIWMFTIGSIISLIISLFITERKHHKKIKEVNPLILFKDSSIQVLRNKSLRRIIYLLILTEPFTHILLFLFQPYFLMATVQNSLWGVTLAIGMTLGAILMKYAYLIEKKLGMNLTIFIATIFPGILYLIMAFFVGPIISLLTFILLKGSMNLRDPLFSQYQNDHIESHNRATVLSIISIILSIYLATMRLIIGKIANENLILAFIMMGIIIIIGAILFRINEKQIKANVNKKYVQ
ncbi:MFS transporter [archaeon]|jgi:MFS family permease|nr:MFS transporter [archaeon]MBT3451065.1 MFS transporter [archaeon]MBT6869155.1 MFS transporter [archaeon]MBT7192802.1 MFS transporter [archaeon]MBT7381342.1 MFS transporter [archaeon]